MRFLTNGLMVPLRGVWGLQFKVYGGVVLVRSALRKKRQVGVGTFFQGCRLRDWV